MKYLSRLREKALGTSPKPQNESCKTWSLGFAEITGSRFHFLTGDTGTAASGQVRMVKSGIGIEGTVTP